MPNDEDMMADIELNDIQGIVARGYGHLEAARFGLFAIRDAAKARRWLVDNLDQNLITRGTERPDRLARNIAFTALGLEALGLRDEIRAGFSEEFLAGMTTPHKRRILGDHSASAPEDWTWGGPGNQPVHGLLLLYASEDQLLESLCEELTQAQASSGIEFFTVLNSRQLPGGKEHFGFRDGIAQPFLAELKPGSDASRAVPFGEFVLGYRNAYKRYSRRPLIAPAGGAEEHLPPDPEASGKMDLGKNGTYLVFRQMEQDVKRFWSFLQEQASADEGAAKEIFLASKMVGRWPSGAPLVKTPDQDQPDMTNLDDFAYHDADAKGHKCPLGAHIRRTHPRDSLEPAPGTQKSIDFSNRHRILRRGRAYGKPFAESMEPQDMLRSLDTGDAGERGLHFICLNADIGRQFEFTQHTWSNNPNFNGLYNDPDPLTGDRGVGERKRDNFTLQADPVRKKVCGMPDFVSVRGGAYFFLPGMRALRYLAAE